MSKYLYLLDPGHGGLNPDTGKYVTSGKRSPKFDDGTSLYEGVNNRELVNKIIDGFRDNDLDAIDIVNTWIDVPLKKRVRTANLFQKERKCVYISIHSDAYGSGWTSPSGISVYTSMGTTKADDFADIVIQELVCNFEDTVKWRRDFLDGDADKEAGFYVLKKTSMPAILCELGFHSNKEEAKRMLTDEWKDKVVKSLVGAVKIFEGINS